MAYEDEQGRADAAAEAFEAVRAEVALLRRAVERLAAERAEQPAAPDYSETLGAILQEIETAGEQVDMLAKSPVLATEPRAGERPSRSRGRPCASRRADHPCRQQPRAGRSQA